MKKIVIICPPSLPIPCVKGGAIEELVTILIKQNEVYKLLDLEVFSIYDKEAAKEGGELLATKSHYIKFTKFHYRLCRKTLRFMQRIVGYKKIISDLYYKKVFKRCKKINPDIIIFEAGRLKEMGRFSDYFGKEKMYVHIHHNLVAEKDESGIFDNSISVSEFVNESWDVNFNEKTKNKRVLYNAIDEKKFEKKLSYEEKQTVRDKYGINKDDFLILYCGRIQPVKGVLELAKAVIKCNKKEIKLMIIGGVNFNNDDSSIYLSELKRLFVSYPEKIIYLGYVKNSELYKYYNISDLQVVPSLWEEAAGLVVIEGQTCGLPQIITNSGGMVEYVSSDSCVIVEKNENIVETLSMNILNLFNSPELRDKLKNKAFENSKRYSKKNYYIEFAKLFCDDLQ